MNSFAFIADWALSCIQLPQAQFWILTVLKPVHPNKSLIVLQLYLQIASILSLRTLCLPLAKLQQRIPPTHNFVLTTIIVYLICIVNWESTSVVVDFPLCALLNESCTDSFLIVIVNWIHVSFWWMRLWHTRRTKTSKVFILCKHDYNRKNTLLEWMFSKKSMYLPLPDPVAYWVIHLQTISLYIQHFVCVPW